MDMQTICTQRERRGMHRQHFWSVAFGVGVALGMLSYSTCHATGDTPSQTAAIEVAASDSPWGIKVVGVRSTAAGHMLEFRYRVVNSDKAKALFERKTKPHLIHSSTGKVLGVPNTAKLGPLRNSNTPLQGRTYWMFFGNAGHLVKAGDTVSVAIGDYHSADLIVE